MGTGSVKIWYNRVWTLGINIMKHINFDLTGLKQWNIPWHTAHKFESSDAAHWKMGQQEQYHPHNRLHLHMCGLLNLSPSVSITNYQYKWKIKLMKALPPVLLHCVRNTAWNERISIAHTFYTYIAFVKLCTMTVRNKKYYYNNPFQ